MNGDEKPGACGIVLDFLTDGKDEIVNRAGCGELVVAPNIVEQHVARHDFSFVFDKIFLEFAIPSAKI